MLVHDFGHKIIGNYNYTNKKSGKHLVGFDIYPGGYTNDGFHSNKESNDDLCENIDLQNVPKDIVWQSKERTYDFTFFIYRARIIQVKTCYVF